jgi:hypothetical protein
MPKASFLRGNLRRAGGGAVVAARANLMRRPQSKIEPVDEAAIAALLAKIAHARPRPFARPARATRLQRDRVHLVTLAKV